MICGDQQNSCLRSFIIIFCSSARSCLLDCLKPPPEQILKMTCWTVMRIAFRTVTVGGLWTVPYFIFLKSLGQQSGQSLWLPSQHSSHLPLNSHLGIFHLVIGGAFCLLFEVPSDLSQWWPSEQPMGQPSKVTEANIWTVNDWPSDSSPRWPSEVTRVVFCIVPSVDFWTINGVFFCTVNGVAWKQHCTALRMVTVEIFWTFAGTGVTF